MKQITSNDTIFATVRGRNSIIANLCLCGMNSMADVVASVRDAVGEGCGLPPAERPYSIKGALRQSFSGTIGAPHLYYIKSVKQY